MQNSENKIDGLFRDKLHGHQVVPPAEVWDNIAGSLDGTKRNRRMIFVWGISLAASLLLAFLSGWYFSGQISPRGIMQAENSAPVPTVILQQEPIQQSSTNSIVQTTRHQLSTPLYSVSNIENTSKSSSSTISEKDLDNSSQRENFFMRLLSPRNSSAKSNRTNIYKLIAMNTSDEFTEADRAIIARNMQTRQQHNKEINKSESGFSVGVQGSPVYRFNGESSQSKDYSLSGVTGSQAYQPNVSGGVAVTYKATKRLSVQSGVSYDRISQDGGEVGVSFAGHNWLAENDKEFVYTGIPSDSRNTSNNVVFETEMGLTNIVMPEGASLATANSTNKLANEATKNYDLKQKASYLEIPMVVRYRIVDQRMGFYMLGGVNTNVLMSNTASLSNNSEVIANGKIEGLNPLTFSSSVGVGMNYAITERFNLSLEPTMKIQLNSLNSQNYTDARPYSVGIYTGLTYNF